MARVVVWPSREVLGWTGTNNEQVEAYPVESLLDALRAHYESDAHFCPLLVADGDDVPPSLPRINQTALETIRAHGSEPFFEVICIDVDCVAAHKGTVDEAPNLWWIEQKRLLAEIPCCKTAGYYRTKRGYRLIWTLEEGLQIKPYLDVLNRLRNTINTRVGTTAEADRLLDYNRSYRLPHVMRGGEFQDLESNFENLGHLDITSLDAGEVSLSGISKAKTFESQVPEGDISEGGRDIGLTRIAGRMRRAGLDYDELLIYLLQVNEKRCKPPLEEEDVERICRSICRYEPEPEHVPAARSHPEMPKQQRLTIEQITARPAALLLGSEYEVAEKVMETLEGQGEKLVFDRGHLFQYIPEVGVWQQVRPEVVRRAVHALDGAGVQKGVSKDGSPRIQPLKVTHNLSDNVLKIIQDQRAKPGFFDKQVKGVCFRNGFFSPTNGFLEHSPSNRTTFYLDFDYERGLKPLLFEKFLRDCFLYDTDYQERIQALREFFGVALLGMSTVYQQALLLVGSGSNGKSVLLETISKLFPKNGVTAVPPHEMGVPHNRARLSNARLNLVTELQEADILSAESFKAIVDGSTMEAAEKYGHPFSFKPSCGHVFAANNLPGARDTSHGFFRRWILCDWRREFREGSEDRDPWLKEKLERELQRIACWLVDGAVEVVARGHYTQVRSFEQLKSDWHKIADPFTLFLEQRTSTEDVQGGIDRTELFKAYRQWCQRTGHMPMAQAGFLRKLGASGVTVVKLKNGSTSYKLRLTEAAY